MKSIKWRLSILLAAVFLFAVVSQVMAGQVIQVDKSKVAKPAQQPQQAEQKLSAEPVRLSFGNVNVEEVSAYQKVVIVNSGNTAVELGLVLTDSDKDNFKFGSGTCQSNTVLQPGGSCNVAIAFAPRAVGDKQAKLSRNATPSLLNVPLTGTGVVKQVKVEPKSVAAVTAAPAPKVSDKAAVKVETPPAQKITQAETTKVGPQAETPKQPLSKIPPPQPGQHQHQQPDSYPDFKVESVWLSVPGDPSTLPKEVVAGVPVQLNCDCKNIGRDSFGGVSVEHHIDGKPINSSVAVHLNVPFNGACGGSIEHTFDKAGTYRYTCEISTIIREHEKNNNHKSISVKVITPKKYKITTSVEPAGGGSINPKVAMVRLGDTQTFKAEPNPGYDKSFSVSPGACELESYMPPEFTIKAIKPDCIVAVHFMRFFTLTVKKEGDGNSVIGTYNPQQNPLSPPSTFLNCGATCAGKAPEHSLINLNAVADSDSIFEGWSGGGCSGTGNCNVSLNDNVTVTAHFSKKAP